MPFIHILRLDRVRCFAVVFVTAIVWRGWALWSISRTFFFEFQIGDAAAYDEWARRIAQGDWLGSEVFYQSPLYPYVLAVIYKTIGDSRLIVAAIQCLCGALAAALLCDAGWRWFSRSVGLTAGFLFAVYAPVIFFDLVVQKSSLDMLLMASLLWLLSRNSACRDHRTLLATGLVAGLMALNRENAILLVAALALWFVWRKPANADPGNGLRSRWSAAAYFLAGATAALFPVALRNRVVGGEWLLTTAQSGPNFYIGNHAGASGSYVPLVAAHGDARFEREDAQHAAEAALGRELSSREVSAYWRSRAWDFIRTSPGDWLRLMLKKFGYFWNWAELTDTEDVYTYAEYAVPLWFPGRGLNFGVLLVLAATGVGWGWTRFPAMRLLCGLIGLYAASVVAFYVVARYRLPIVPPLVLLAAVGVVDALPALLRRRTEKRGVILVVMLLVAMLTAWPLVDIARQQTGTRLNFGAELQDRGRAAEAAEVFRAVLQVSPRMIEANYNLGRAYISLGRLPDAGAAFVRALELDPTFEEAALNAGNVALELGQYPLAERYYVHALSLRPDDSRVHFGLGTLYATLQNWTAAIQHLEAAVRLAPENTAAQENLERARRMQAGLMP